MSHNSKLKQLMKSIRRDLKSASNRPTLEEITERLRAIGGSLKFNDTGKLGTGLLILGAAIYFGILHSNNDLSIAWLTTDQLTYTLAGMGIVGVALCIFYFVRRSKTKSFIELVYKFGAVVSYGLAERDPPDAKYYSKLYMEFDRGNYSKDFRWYASGLHAGQSGEFKYDLFHFHWVVERTETVTVSDGKGGSTTETRTTYDHFHRYGLIAQGYNTSIQVLSKKPNKTHKIRYTPSSKNFRDEFTVRCVEEFQASKLLKPAVVVALEDALNELKNLNIEFNDKGEMCITTEDELFDAKAVMGSSQSAEKLASIIEAGAKVPCLEKLLFLADTLRRYTDNNFS